MTKTKDLVCRIAVDIVTFVAFVAGVVLSVLKGLSVFFGLGVFSLSLPVTIAIGSLALAVWVFDGLRVNWRPFKKNDEYDPMFVGWRDDPIII